MGGLVQYIRGTLHATAKIQTKTRTITSVLPQQLAAWEGCQPIGLAPLLGLERYKIFTDEEWEAIYSKAERYLGTSRDEFTFSIQQGLVIDTLGKALKRLSPDSGREILPLPLACKRNKAPQNTDFVAWAATDTVLSQTVRKLHLMSDHHCTKILHDRNDKSVILASVKGLRDKKQTYIIAQKYVVCGPLPDRANDDLLPNHSKPITGRRVTIPVHDKFPWHTQIHRDAFSYGDVSAAFDSRLVVDFRFFGMVETERTNYAEFSTEIFDQFHMLQPMFHFIPCTAARDRAQWMVKDMCTLALELGGFLPGSEPQFLEPGLALHNCGTTRAGDKKEDSVVDKHSKVWDVNNLWLGDNGVIPIQNASNPTLTSMCFAIQGAKKLIAELKEGK